MCGREGGGGRRTASQVGAALKKGTAEDRGTADPGAAVHPSTVAVRSSLPFNDDQGGVFCALGPDGHFLNLCQIHPQNWQEDSTDSVQRCVAARGTSGGWGDQLIWAQTYEEALFWSRSRNKPLVVLFHLEDCPHSQALKKMFSEDDQLQKILDEDFIVLNLVYETTDKHLSPDGQYVPRILFVDPSMTVRADINGRYANRLYAYEPSDITLLKSNMQKAKKLLKSEL
uniref:(Atlantic silverside) hypothetical protein n=1 Tax=Menidia menidia TaxID=238744 RepID=A0A8S4BDP8_9TELE|nr:unnamed protein product [Menidia menidia]